MNSIEPKFTTYRIALFQGGLNDNGYGFNDTIDNLDKASSKVINSNEKIDMRHFNPVNCSFYRTNVDGYYSKSTIAQNDFETQITRIIELAKQHVGKTIMVSTFLNRGFIKDNNLDSVENQKIKLCYIVDEFKKYDNVEIILVGHSQGGVVNLETAIERSAQISRLISISTPYAPVCLANTLVFINFVASLGGIEVYNIFAQNKENIPAYKACVEKMSSSAYFDDLKARWDALTTRPKLTAITGVAGHLFRVVPGYAGNGVMNPSTLYKEPFDGLVTIGEQKAISHAEFIDLVNDRIPCYAEKTYTEPICAVQQGFVRTCDHNCPLESISLSGTIMEAIRTYVASAQSGVQLSSFPAMMAINAGLAKDESSCPVGYENFYMIFSNAYNHDQIRYNCVTTGHLLVLLTT